MTELVITEKHTELEIYKYLYSIQDEFFIRRADGISKKFRKFLKHAPFNKQLLLNTYSFRNVTVLLFGQHLKNNLEFGLVFIVNINGKYSSYEIYGESDETKLAKTIPHFFSRYKERQNINKTGIELIKHFYINNIKDTELKTIHLYKGKEQIFSVFKEGVGLSIYENIGGCKIKVNKTYLSNELLKENQTEVTNDIIRDETIAEEEYKQRISQYKKRNKLSGLLY